MLYFLKLKVFHISPLNKVIDEKLKGLNKIEENMKETNEIVNKMNVELKRNQLQNEENINEIVEKITKTIQVQNSKILQELTEIKENQNEINLYFKQFKQNKITKIEKQNKMFIKFEKYF
jgi:hypothetical protein